MLGWISFSAFGLFYVTDKKNDVTLREKKITLKNVSIGLPHIQNNIENKINSKFEVNTIYRRSDADTKLPTVRTVFTIIIFACDIFVFLLKLSLKNIIINKKLPIILSSRRKRAIQCFYV